MPAFILNGTIAAPNTAEDILPQGHSLTAVVLSIEDGGSVRFNVGANATASLGELIVAPADGVASATITNLVQQRISVYGTASNWSIRTAA